MAKYIIKSEFNGEVNVIDQSTTKREITSKFNRLMKLFSRDGKMSVENIREGYSKVIFWSTYGYSVTEYWICRA